MVHGGTHTHTHTHTHTQTQRDNQTTKTIGPHLFGAVGVDVAGPGRRNRVDWPDPPPNPFNPFTFFWGGGGFTRFLGLVVGGFHLQKRVDRNSKKKKTQKHPTTRRPIT